MYKIIIACGTGVTTSSIIRQRVVEGLRKRGITADIIIIRAIEAQKKAMSIKPDLAIFSGNVPGKISCPVVSGLPWLTGVGLDKAYEEVVSILKNIKK